MAGVAQGWAEKDGGAALAWARSLTEGSERDSALRCALIGWAKSDPVTALNHLEAAPPGQDGSAADVAQHVLYQAAEKNLDATIAWLADNGGKIGREPWLGLTPALNKKLASGPETFLSWITAQPDPVRRGLASVFNFLTSYDAYAANRDTIWNWLEQQPRDEFTDNLRGMALRATARQEPGAITRMMENMSDHPEARRILEQNLTSLVNNGNLQRIEEFLAAAPESMRPHLLGSAFLAKADAVEGDWSLHDLEPWLQRLHELPADQRSKAAGGLASRMAAADPQAAAQWAVSLTDPDARRSAIDGLTKSWAWADSYEASEWVAGLAVGADRDAAAQALVRNITRDDPESAWTWAAAIGDGEMRLSSLQSVLSLLQQQDPPRARQWLDAASLSASQRSALLSEWVDAPAGEPLPAH